MTAKVALAKVSLVGVWTWWWVRSREPGTPIAIPPMPPLEEWPKDLFETFEQVTGVALKDVEFYEPPE
jgi:hypothetical protein